MDGTPLKNSYRGRWSVILDKLQKCLSRLVESAALRRRNYVIDQVSFADRKKKLKNEVCLILSYDTLFSLKSVFLLNFSCLLTKFLFVVECEGNGLKMG